MFKWTPLGAETYILERQVSSKLKAIIFNDWIEMKRTVHSRIWKESWMHREVTNSSNLESSHAGMTRALTLEMGNAPGLILILSPR